MASNFRVTRKVRQGRIEVSTEHPCAVDVHYALEIVNVDESGRVLNVIETTEDRRIIPIDASRLLVSAVKGSNVSVASIASDVISACKYIHSSRTEEVEQVLTKLRRIVAEAKEKEAADKAKKIAVVSKTEAKNANKQTDNLPPARIEDVDDYLELLYQMSTGNNEDGLQSQIRGTAMILKLCRSVGNLELLIHNSTLMGALARVLQEEYKKSSELSFNILRIFLAFSNFMEMHAVLAHYRIGLFTLKTVEFELRRAETRELDAVDKAAKYERDMLKLNADENLTNEERKSKREAMKSRAETDAGKARKQQQRQDKVLFVAFYLLLNLAEDLGVEKKMIKKDVVKFLAGSLDRSSVDLLLLVVTFLKKISVFEDNKDAIKSIHIADGSSSPVPSQSLAIKPVTVALCKLLSGSSTQLTTMTLRMLFNLSFDKDLRTQMINSGLLPKVVGLLKVQVPSIRSKLLKVLYHLTIDEKSRAMFSYTDGVPLVVGMIVNFPQKVLPKELAALGVNLSLHPKNVEQIVQSKGLGLLMDRLLSVEDVIDNPPPKDGQLLKIIRNISHWTFTQQQTITSPEQYSHRGLWTPHIKTLVRVALESYNNHDLLVELFGILSNLTSMDLPANQGWSKLLNMTAESKSDLTLLDLIIKIFTSGSAIQDIVLETANLVGAVSDDAMACKVIAKSTLIKSMCKLWRSYPAQEVEIHLQFLYCFYNLSTQSHTQEACYADEKVLNLVIDYMTHKCEAIRSIAFEICGRVQEIDREDTGQLGSLGERIRSKRFEYYNQLWIMETQQDKRDSYDDDFGSSIVRGIRRSPSFDGDLDEMGAESDDRFGYYGRGK